MRCAVMGLTAALLSAAAISGTAWAQRATAELEMQAGPGKRFPLVARIERDGTFQVHGCVEGYAWCDVSRQDDRGWVPADQIEYRFQDRDVRVSEYGPRLEIPVVGFAFSAYWDAYYSGRPWYQERDRWKNMWRDQPEYLRYGRAERPTSPGGTAARGNRNPDPLGKRNQRQGFGAAAEGEARAALQRDANTRVEQDDANSDRDGRDRDGRLGEGTGPERGPAAGINSQPGITKPDGNKSGQPGTSGGPTSGPSVSGPTPGNPASGGGTAGSTSGAASGSGSGTGTGGGGSGGGSGGGGGGGGS